MSFVEAFCRTLKLLQLLSYTISRKQGTFVSELTAVKARELSMQAHRDILDACQQRKVKLACVPLEVLNEVTDVLVAN